MGLDPATVRSVSANGSDAAVAVHLVPDAFRRSLGIRVDVASRVSVGAANARMATHGLAGFASLRLSQRSVDELRDLLRPLDPKARDTLRRVLIHDQADRDAAASQLLRYRDGHGEDWADIIDLLTMHPSGPSERPEVTREPTRRRAPRVVRIDGPPPCPRSLVVINERLEDRLGRERRRFPRSCQRRA